jgi:peroxiredoxin
MFNPFKKKLKTGDLAPDFYLPSHLGGRIRLSGFRGKKNVLIAFYPLDWTPV